MSTDGTKSALAWLTAGTSAVVCIGFAQTAGGRYFRTTSKKPKATDLTTAVDHGKMISHDSIYNKLFFFCMRIQIRFKVLLKKARSKSRSSLKTTQMKLN